MVDAAGINGLQTEILHHLNRRRDVRAATATICENWLKCGERGIGQDFVWLALGRLETRELVWRESASGEVLWSQAGKGPSVEDPLAHGNPYVKQGSICGYASSD